MPVLPQSLNFSLPDYSATLRAYYVPCKVLHTERENELDIVPALKNLTFGGKREVMHCKSFCCHCASLQSSILVLKDSIQGSINMSVVEIPVQLLEISLEFSPHKDIYLGMVSLSYCLFNFIFSFAFISPLTQRYSFFICISEFLIKQCYLYSLKN